LLCIPALYAPTDFNCIAVVDLDKVNGLPVVDSDDTDFLLDPNYKVYK